MDARVDSRIPEDIKLKANKVLADHGLTISSFIRIALTSVANDGLPKYWGIPNTGAMKGILEAADDIKAPHLKGANSYEELEKLLDE